MLFHLVEVPSITADLHQDDIRIRCHRTAVKRMLSETDFELAERKLNAHRLNEQAYAPKRRAVGLHPRADCKVLASAKPGVGA